VTPERPRPIIRRHLPVEPSSERRGANWRIDHQRGARRSAIARARASQRRCATGAWRSLAAIALSGHVAALTWASSSVAPAGGRSSATATLQARVIEAARAAPAALTSDSSAATSLTVASPRDVGAPFHTERTAKKAEPDRSISAPVPRTPRPRYPSIAMGCSSTTCRGDAQPCTSAAIIDRDTVSS
jgi:hypothetical protein